VGLLLIPALLHDYGYKYDELIKIDSNGKEKPYNAGAGKDFWDELFKKEADRVNGMVFINIIAWLAVSWFGDSSWNRHRKQDAKPKTAD
jgi:hypothetical protein